MSDKDNPRGKLVPIQHRADRAFIPKTQADMLAVAPGGYRVDDGDGQERYRRWLRRKRLRKQSDDE